MIYALRFTVAGERRYETLGGSWEGWTKQRAETHLRHLMADIERGIWRPSAPVQQEAVEDIPTFHLFASEWFERQKLEAGRRGTGLAVKSVADLEWRLSNHLLPVFKDKRLDEITVEDVDRYRLRKRTEAQRVEAAAAKGEPLVETIIDRSGRTRERRRTALSPASINKTLTTLAAILDAAVEYGLVDRNVARGRRRRLAGSRPPRTWIDRADQLQALLDGAGILDSEARVCAGQRRALIARSFSEACGSVRRWRCDGPI